MLQTYQLYSSELSELPEGRLLITTINAHSYNVAQHDADFAEALRQSDVLLPDGISIVLAKRLLSGDKIKKIAGEDLFYWEMGRMKNLPPNPLKGYQKTASALFIGSTEMVLAKIKARVAIDFPNVEVHTYSPPYKAEFTAEDNRAMVEVINKVNPDVLFVGMTAPKQEKWALKMINDKRLVVNNCHVCCIGAVFDFYAGTVKRAPQWIIKIGLEWFYRLVSEPKRMWRRYLVGNVKFVWAIVLEKMNSN